MHFLRFQHIWQTISLLTKVIKYSKYFQPGLQQHDFTPKAMSRLAVLVSRTLGQKSMRITFELKENDNENDLCDLIKRQATEYQTETLPKLDVQRKQNSYWKYAYGLVGIDVENEMQQQADKSVPIDQYWGQV